MSGKYINTKLKNELTYNCINILKLINSKNPLRKIENDS